VPTSVKKQKSSKKENMNKDKKQTKKRIGLKNLGNTCFMNSVLQSLSNIEEFCNVLTNLPSLDDQIKSSKELKKNVDRRISDGVIVIDELKKVLMALKQSEDKNALSPDSLFQAIWKVVPRFRGYQQQDAHEFLRYMLDRLHTELLALLPGKLKAEPKIQTSSLVTSVFGGSLQSCVTCLTCKQTSKKNDPFLDLSIDIPQIYTGPSRKSKDKEILPVCHIHDCLQKFVEREELGDSERFFCNSCKSKQPSTKQFWIRRLPTVLCLHIKRFRWSAYARTKIDTFIEFPLNGLDMSGYLLKNLSGTRFSNAGSSLYDLAAVIVHHGTGAGSGHYTAFATNNQAWFNFNDCSVKETDYQTVNSSRAYILFYVHRDFQVK
jgi:ubiquitin carboxyl-terminal hydrolase 3